MTDQLSRYRESPSSCSSSWLLVTRYTLTHCCHQRSRGQCPVSSVHFTINLPLSSFKYRQRPHSRGDERHGHTIVNIDINHLRARHRAL